MQARSPRARNRAPVGSLRPGPFLAVACALALLGAGAGDARAAGKKGEFALGVYFGSGNYDLADFNNDLAMFGYSPIENGIEYGFGGDYRFSDWISAGLQAMRIGGTTTPPAGVDPTTAATYGVHASPLVVNLIVHPYRSAHVNVDIFGGAGPLLSTSVSSTHADFSSAGSKVGTYAHVGGGVEYRFSPMVGLSLSALARSARTNGFDLRNQTGDPEALWDLSFDGSAIWFGPRIYLGATD